MKQSSFTELILPLSNKPVAGDAKQGRRKNWLLKF